MKARRRFILLVIGYWLLVIGYTSYAQEETLTISTYYPAPHGVYRTLRLYPNTNNPLGSFCPQEGALSYNDNTNQIFLCNNAKTWQSLAGEEKYWTTTTINTGLAAPNDTFAVLHPKKPEWNVGIGFPVNVDGTLNNPDFNAKLQVNGAVGGDTRFESTIKSSLISLSTGYELIVGNPGCNPVNPNVSYATLLGGTYTAATGEGAVAFGGSSGLATPPCFPTNRLSSWAGGDYSVVAGGDNNRARGNFSVVSGLSNLVNGNHGVVSGGEDNQIAAVGSDFSTISGGQDNRILSGNASTISGGSTNRISSAGDFSTISGGRGNLDRTFASVVSGGRDNIAGAIYSWAGGRNMRISSGAGGNRTFAWGHSASLHPIADNDAFIIYSDRSPFRVELGNSPQVAGKQTDLFVYNLPQGTGDTLKYVSSPIDPNAGRIFWEPSSIRYKTNLRPIDNALAKVKQLRGVYFNWKETGKPALGMIAEEVGAVIPEVVSYEANGQDARSLDYDKLVGLLIEAIKEQEKEIAELEQEIEGLEKG